MDFQPPRTNVFGLPIQQPQQVIAEAMQMPVSPDPCCDFCDGEPVVWAYPTGEVHSGGALGDGLNIVIPMAASTWYACARCHVLIAADRWSDLAQAVYGRPQIPPSWGSWRTARNGPGHAWPIPHPVPAAELGEA
jgi:hypothetical protein